VHSGFDFSVSSVQHPDQKIEVTAVILLKLTHDLPESPVVH